jgi:hypothetical protein
MLLYVHSAQKSRLLSEGNANKINLIVGSPEKCRIVDFLWG